MTRKIVLGFVLLAALDTLAHVCFKLTAVGAGPLRPDLQWVVAALSQPWLYGAIGGYVGAFLVWMTVLRVAPVGPAFAVSHVDVVTVLVASSLVLHEAVSRYQLVGAAMIVGGIGCLALARAR